MPIATLVEPENTRTSRIERGSPVVDWILIFDALRVQGSAEAGDALAERRARARATEEYFIVQIEMMMMMLVKFFYESSACLFLRIRPTTLHTEIRNLVW